MSEIEEPTIRNKKKRVQKRKDFVRITPEVNVHSHGYNQCVEHMENMV